MSILSIITSLITLGANASWVDGPLMGIVLKIDGWIYELVSKAFNLFMLMCSVNFNSISGLIAPLLDRIQAVILVFVVFKLGVSLITYLLNPEKAAQEGSKIIINIFITAAFLIGYNFVFGVFNELNLLIMGNPTNYPYTTLSTVADLTNGDSDKGLIMRFVFGDSEEVEDVGDFLAFETLSIFIYNWDNPGSQSILEREICTDGICEFGNLSNVSGRIGKDLEFHPGGLIIGLFLIYSIVKSAIQIGIRMFKLIILQMLAPLAIVSILEGGIKAKTFQNYVQKYISVFLEAAIRMVSMLIITVFVCQFFVNSNDFFGNLPGDSGWVQFLIKVLLVAAGYQFASELPKFVDEIIGTHLSGGGNNKGLNFLGGLIGGVAGGALGLATGVTSGIAAGAGVTGTLGNAFSGMVGGASGGAKGKNIAEKFKSIGENNKNNQERALRIARQGGGLSYAGQQIEGFFGVPSSQAAETQRIADTSTALENMISARSAAIAEEVSAAYTDSATGEKFEFRGADGKFLKYGSSAEDFSAKAVENDQTAKNLLMTYQDQSQSITDRQAAYDQYLARRKTVTDAAERYYNESLFTNANVNASKTVQETTSLYDKRAEAGEKSSDLAKYQKDGRTDVKAGIKQTRLNIAGRKADSENRGASRRANRQGRYGGK